MTRSHVRILEELPSVCLLFLWLKFPISFSSSCTRHFTLPHHPSTFSRIYPLCGRGRHVWQIVRQPPCHHHPPANNPSTTIPKIRLSVSAFPPHPIGFQLNVPMVAHFAPKEVPHLQQIHTQALVKNHNPSSTVCLHTPAWHRSRTLNFPYSARVSSCHLHITSSPSSPNVSTRQFRGYKRE